LVPGFEPALVRNDFALLHLNSEFELSDTLDTICMPGNTNATTDAIGEQCIATGWGKDTAGKKVYTVKKNPIV
jgi:hypothetical protein